MKNVSQYRNLSDQYFCKNAQHNLLQNSSCQKFYTFLRIDQKWIVKSFQSYIY